MGIEYPDVKVGAFIPAVPESICCDIEPCPILGVCRCTGQLFTQDWLEMGFDAHLIADL